MGQCSAHLTFVTLQKCWRITDEGVAALVEGCTKLESLQIVWQDKLTDASLQAISRHARRLLSLVVDWCSFTTAGFVALIAECPSLQVLSLHRCFDVDESAVVAACMEHHVHVKFEEVCFC